MSKTITEDDVRHVAKLSRLKLSDDEVSHFATQLDAVIGYVSKLNEVDIDGVEPMAHALDLNNVLRQDTESPGMDVAEALANAPDKDEPFFKVPKVLGDGPSS